MRHRAKIYFWHSASMLLAMSDRPAKELDKIMVRLPDGMRDRLTALAKENKRSVNAEVVARLEASLDNTARAKAGSTVETTVYVLLDTDGMPTSWSEIHEHLATLTKAGPLNVSTMEVHVITPRMISSTERTREADALAKKYRALARKARLTGSSPSSENLMAKGYLKHREDPEGAN